MSGEQMGTKLWNSEERFGPNIYICYSSRHRKKWKQWERLGLPKENKVSESLRCPRTDSAAAAAKSPQSCPTLCDLIDGSQPGSPHPGILQARVLEWVAISFSNAWKWKVKVKSLSHVQLPVTPWTAAYQAPLSVGFSRQEYWSGVPLPSPSTRLAQSKILIGTFLEQQSPSHIYEVLSKCLMKRPEKQKHFLTLLAAAAAAKLLQSCPTLCDPIDDSPPGSPVPGILQARTLEWVAISFSNAWKGKEKPASLKNLTKEQQRTRKIATSSINAKNVNDRPL